jgi:hypothetical protein
MSIHTALFNAVDMLGEWLYTPNDDDQTDDEDDESFMLSYTNVILGHDNSIPISQEQLQDIVIDNSGINDNSIPILQEQLQDIVIDNSGIHNTSISIFQDPLEDISVDNLCVRNDHSIHVLQDQLQAIGVYNLCLGNDNSIHVLQDQLDQVPTNSVANLYLRPASTRILRNHILDVGFDNDSLVPATSLPGEQVYINSSASELVYANANVENLRLLSPDSQVALTRLRAIRQTFLDIPKFDLFQVDCDVTVFYISAHRILLDRSFFLPN